MDLIRVILLCRLKMLFEDVDFLLEDQCVLRLVQHFPQGLGGLPNPRGVLAQHHHFSRTLGCGRPAVPGFRP
jgi:hypothetical protein